VPVLTFKSSPTPSRILYRLSPGPGRPVLLGRLALTGPCGDTRHSSRLSSNSEIAGRKTVAIARRVAARSVCPKARQCSNRGSRRFSVAPARARSTPLAMLGVRTCALLHAAVSVGLTAEGWMAHSLGGARITSERRASRPRTLTLRRGKLPSRRVLTCGSLPPALGIHRRPTWRLTLTGAHRRRRVSD
jgi:hypothetical protein